jgi:hypothetical protein
MNPAEAQQIVRRMSGIWGPLREREQQREWIEFLVDYEQEPAVSAVLALRGIVKWQPTMSEFRAAYLKTLEDRPIGGDQVNGRRLLNGKVETNAEANQALYGSAVDSWVYCWQCDMAVTLDERLDSARYRHRYGWAHDTCPPHGSRPSIPNDERRLRAEYWQRVGVSV